MKVTTNTTSILEVNDMKGVIKKGRVLEGKYLTSMFFDNKER